MEETAAVAAAADRMPLRLVSDPSDPHVWIGDREITLEIREPRIALAIKHISTNLDVRAWMATEQRRRMMEPREEGTGMIPQRRDITSDVGPDSDLPILADSQVSEFMVAAPGVETVDSTGLDVDGVCEAVLVFVDRDLAERDASR